MAGQPVTETAAQLAGLALGPSSGPVGETVAGVWIAAGRPERPGAMEVAELAGWVLAAPAFQQA